MNDINKQHKQLLKSALLENYDSITNKEKHMKKTKTRLFNNKLIVGLATLTIVALTTVGVFNLREGELTAQKAFAQASAYYERNNQQGRYLYRKIEHDSNLKSDPQGQLGKLNEVYSEMWFDTVTGNFKNIDYGINNQIVSESMMIDGVLYEKLHEAPHEPVFADPEIEAFYTNADESGFPDGYKSIGFNSFDELYASDLTPRQVDDLLETQGYPRIEESTLLDEELLESMQKISDMYDTEAGSLEDANNYYDLPYNNTYVEESIHPQTTQDDEAAYEMCRQYEEDLKASTRAQDLITGNPTKLPTVFKELSDSELFEIEETKWRDQEVLKLSRRSEMTKGEESITSIENYYLNKSDFSFVGIESAYGGVAYASEVIEFSVSDEPVDFSTEGFDKFEETDMELEPLNCGSIKEE